MPADPHTFIIFRAKNLLNHSIGQPEKSLGAERKGDKPIGHRVRLLEFLR
jgi:hypothetical protein